MVVEEKQERSNNPRFDFDKSVPLMGPGVKIKISGVEPRASGSNKWGAWYLWIAEVQNCKVFEGRGKDEKEINGYSGEGILFAKENMNNEIKTAIGNEEGVEVIIKKEVEETTKGLIKRYVIDKVGGGNPSTEGLTPSEKKLVTDASELVNSGYVLKEEDFIRASKDTSLYGTMTDDRVKELFKLVK